MDFRRVLTRVGACASCPTALRANPFPHSGDCPRRPRQYLVLVILTSHSRLAVGSRELDAVVAQRRGGVGSCFSKRRRRTHRHRDPKMEQGPAASTGTYKARQTAAERDCREFQWTATRRAHERHKARDDVIHVASVSSWGENGVAGINTRYHASGVVGFTFPLIVFLANLRLTTDARLNV